MYLGYKITVPANTLESDPLETLIEIDWGLINYFSYYIPMGAAGLTHFVVEYHESQIFPDDPDENFSVCGSLVEYNPRAFVRTSPLLLKISAWNLDDTYEHSIYLHIGTQRTDLIEVLERLMKGV